MTDGRGKARNAGGPGDGRPGDRHLTGRRRPAGAPDGTDYQEWITWTAIVPPERIALLHGESRDDPNAFESTLAFEPHGTATRIFPQRFFRENLHLGEGGEEGRDNDIARETFERTGSSVMGKRMFDLGEQAWPQEAPFHTPVFVVTHQQRDPWVRPGGTTFHFVDDGIHSALGQARDAAGDRDVRIAGGSETILQYLNAGLVDEFTIALAPVLFGAGTRLFDGVDASRVALKPVRSEPSSRVTHLTYAVHSR